MKARYTFTRLMPVHPTALLLLLVLPVSIIGLHADTVILKNGKRYFDVRTRPSGRTHLVYFKNGRRKRIKNKTIKILRISRVSWKRPVRPKPKRRMVAMRKFDPLFPDPLTVPNLVFKDNTPAPAPAGIWGLSPLTKSTMMPGWGQVAVERKWAGYAFLGGAAFFLARYLQIRLQHDAAELDFQDPIPTAAIVVSAPGSNILVPPATVTEQAINGIALNFIYLEEKKKGVLRLEEAGNNSLIFLGLIYAWNLFDIWWFERRGASIRGLSQAPDEDPSVKPDFKVSAGKDVMSFSMEWKF